MALKAALERRFWRWIARRSPKAQQVVLKHQSIYVLPTRQGWLFAVVLVVMWLLGTNYQSNLILAIVFLLFSMMVVSILHTYRNLSGLRLQGLAARPVFAGEAAEFSLRVSALRPGHYDNIQLSLDPSLMVALDLVREEERDIKLVQASHQRGWMGAERLLIQTRFPLGLMRAWSWVHLDMQVLVYPRPIACEDPPLGQASEGEGNLVAKDNPEDFYGFQPYRPGASLSQVAWKHYARGAGLYLKEYVGYQSQNLWLDWDALRGLDTEARLSRLCYWMLKLGKTTGHYGLRLPGSAYELGQGEAHQSQLLKALALYQDSKPRRKAAE